MCNEDNEVIFEQRSEEGERVSLMGGVGREVHFEQKSFCNRPRQQCAWDGRGSRTSVSEAVCVNGNMESRGELWILF